MRRFHRRHSFGQVVMIYGSNEAFIAQNARAQFILNSLYTEPGSNKGASRWNQNAEDLRNKITGSNYSVRCSEEDYAKLVKSLSH